MTVHRVLAVLAVLSLGSCAVFPARYPLQHPEYNRLDSEFFSPDEFVFYDRNNVELMRRFEEIAKLPTGAEVEITSQTEQGARTIIVGTVLHTSPEGIALINCKAFTDVPFFSASRIFKTTETGAQRFPVKWIPSIEIKNTRVLQPAPVDYVAPKLNINTDCGVLFTEPSAPHGSEVHGSNRSN